MSNLLKNVWGAILYPVFIVALIFFAVVLCLFYGMERGALCLSALADAVERPLRSRR